MLSNTQKIVTILACSVILSACTNSQPNQTPNEQKEPSQAEQGLKGKYSFKSLLSLGKNFTCTYKFTDPENKTETTGKSYIAGKKIYQETDTVNLADKTKSLKGSVLSDGEYVYTWSPDKKTSGMKIKIEDQKVEDGNTKTDVAGAKENMEMEYDMDCSPWKVNESIFTLPEGITFTDLSEMMNNLPQMPSLPAMQP